MLLLPGVSGAVRHLGLAIGLAAAAARRRELHLVAPRICRRQAPRAHCGTVISECGAAGAHEERGRGAVRIQQQGGAARRARARRRRRDGSRKLLLPDPCQANKSQLKQG